jgi:hypothetical protein
MELSAVPSSGGTPNEEALAIRGQSIRDDSPT